jgi:hypothetical protein
MTFEPSKWYVSALDFLGSIVPGASIIYILLRFAAATGGYRFTLSADWPKTTIDWAGFLVASFILGRLAHPLAHVLNKLYDRTHRQWRRSAGDPLLEEATRIAGSAVDPKDSLYAWAKSEVTAADPKQAAVIDIIEGTSKMFRTLSFTAFLATILAVIAQAWLVSLVLLAAAILGFLVFSERRFAATKEVYQSLKRIKGKP